jgi:AbiV family abortive infection protein
VPISKIADGVALCKRNIVDYIKDARLIIEDGRLYHAVINVEFALEEFGKALLIIEAKQESTNKVDIKNGQKKSSF